LARGRYIGYALLAAAFIVWFWLFPYRRVEEVDATGFAFKVAWGEARKRLGDREYVGVSMGKMPDTIFGRSYTFYFYVSDNGKLVGKLIFDVLTPGFFAGGCVGVGGPRVVKLEYFTL
jgi:hypothetical protein